MSMLLVRIFHLDSVYLHHALVEVVHVTALPSASSFAYSSPTTAATNSSHLTLELDVKPSVWRL